MTGQYKTALHVTFKITMVTLPVILLAGCGADLGGSGLSSGSDRLTWSNQAIQLDASNAPTITTSSAGGSVSASGLSLIPTLSLTASLAPPTSAGTTLQADDITISGTKVYLAYNVAGDAQAGGVDVIDVTLPVTPVLTSEQIYPTTDIHKVYVSAGYLYTAGATSSGTYPGAVVTKTLLTSAGNLTTTQTSVPLMATDGSGNAAYAAVSITSNGTNLYALAGTNGGIYKLNTSDLSLVSTTTLADARDLNYAGTGLYVLSGQISSTPATVQQYTPSSMAATGTNVTFPTATISASKSTMVAGTSMNVATASSGGVRVYCRATGATIANIPAPAVTGLTAAQQTSNAAAFGNGLLFVANGEAGIYLYTVEQTLGSTGCTNVTVNYRGNFTLGTGLSSNNVYFSGGNLYVANGLGGFKVITVVQTLLTGLVTSL